MTPIAKNAIFRKAIPKILNHTHLIDTMYFKGIQEIDRTKPLNVYYLNYLIGWQPLKLSTKAMPKRDEVQDYIDYG